MHTSNLHNTSARFYHSKIFYIITTHVYSYSRVQSILPFRFYGKILVNCYLKHRTH